MSAQGKGNVSSANVAVALGTVLIKIRALKGRHNIGTDTATICFALSGLQMSSLLTHPGPPACRGHNSHSVRRFEELAPDVDVQYWP